MRYIKIPNLPQSDVGLMAVSATYPNILNTLKKLGIKVIPVKPRPMLETPIQSHADILCHHLGGSHIIVAKGEKFLQSELKKFGFDVIESLTPISSPYPSDVGLNAARVGNHLIANFKSLDSQISDFCFKADITPIKVKQGYAKCSVAVIDKNSIITSDYGIGQAAEKAGMEVLIIKPGYIRLPGYSYGFIGGCCGMIGRHHLAFAGNPVYHPDFFKMKTFLECRQIKMIALSEGQLIDIGGLIPLMEKKH
ncbi:MAG: CoA transferase [Oscillospiraceae bacterium]|jgi:hypothetical protein